MIKEIYEIELRRLHKIGIFFIIIVAAITSFWITIFTAPYVTTNYYVQEIKSLIIFLFTSFGIILPIFSQSLVGSDYKYGIIATYLSYPLKASYIISAKLSAQFTYYFIGSLASLLLLIFLYPFSPEYLALIFATYLLSLAILYILTQFSLIFIKFQPLPQFFTLLLFFVLIYKGSSITGLLYMINPIALIWDWSAAGTIPLNSMLYGLLSIPFYLFLFFISNWVFNRIEWGRGGGI